MSKAFAVFALFFVVSSAGAQPPSSEAEIQAFLDEWTAAWNRADAAALASHVQKDITFTVLDGGLFEGRDVFESKHRGILTGAFKGTTLAFRARRVKLLRPDVAIVDVETSMNGVDRAHLQTSLLLVLEKDGPEWLIAAFHNTAQRSLAPQ
jgi:uncharacterized protein (TIGR02246 family)